MMDRPHLAPHRRPQRERHTDSLRPRGSASDSGLGDQRAQQDLTDHGRPLTNP